MTNKVKDDVANAQAVQVAHADSALETAMTRLGYARITPGSSGGNEHQQKTNTTLLDTQAQHNLL